MGPQQGAGRLGLTDPLTGRERRLRRATIGLSMLTAVLLLVIGGIVAYWLLYLLGPEGDPFTRGPYLLRVGSTSAELRWRTDGDQAVEVVAVDGQGREVVARDGVLAGLRPGVRYAWTASVEGVGRASGSFSTPSPNPDQPVRLAVVGDHGDGGDQEWAVARTIAASRPDLVLTAGDNSYLSAAGILLDRNIFRPLADVMRNAPVYVGLGDHDALPPGDGAIRAAFDLPPRGRHAVAHGSVQAVFLGDQADAEGLAFARRELARPGFRRRFVVVHRPPRPGDPLLLIARAAGVDAVLSGHLHRYERRTVDGVRAFTVGTGGAPIGDDDFTRETAGAEVSLTDHGHLRIDIAGPRVRYTFIDLGGRVLDRSEAL